uniref:hypothetical protein n=1 Tax=Thermococcus sp. TaxID=35749 RepID=UPI0026268D04
LTYVTPQMPPLQIAATYWALSSKYPQFKTYAEIILGYLLHDLAKGYNYQLIINNYTSPYLTFNNSYANASEVGSATMMVSGYVSSQLPRGYVAKAYIAKVLTVQHRLIGIQRVLAGGYYGYYGYLNTLTIGIPIYLPSSITPIGGGLDIYERHIGYTFDVVKFNNKSWYYAVGYYQIPPEYIHSGKNFLYLRVTSNDEDEIGVGSGSWVSLTYKTSTLTVSNPGLVRLYNVTSEGTGIYYLNSLFVPGNVTGISIKLTVSGVHVVRIYYSNGTGMALVYEKRLSSTGLQTIYIPNSTIVPNITKYTTLQDLSKKNFKLIIMLDAYYNPNYSRPVRYAGQDYKYYWDNVRKLYGYPYSYINITYIPKVRVSKFTVPMEEMYNLSPSTTSYYMTFSYYLPEKAIPWYVDIWSGVVYTPGSANPQNYIYVYEGPDAGTEFLTFPLDFYMIRLAYTRIIPNIMIPGGWNTFYIESGDPYYFFRPQVSRAIVHYFLNGYAPYGKVFPYYAQNNACGYNLTYYYNLSGTVYNGTVLIGNCRPTQKPLPLSASQLKPKEYALDNAIFRLFVQLGAKNETTYLPGTAQNPIAVDLQGLQVEAIGVRNVPTSIAPIEVTLRVWRG